MGTGMEPIERGRSRPSASNTTLHDGRSRAVSATTFGSSTPQQGAIRATSQCDQYQRSRKRFQPDLNPGQNKRASSLRGDLLMTPPSRPSTPALEPNLGDIPLTLMNGPPSTSIDMMQWSLYETASTYQSTSSDPSTIRSAYSTPLTHPSVSPSLQPVPDGGVDYFQYDNSFDVFGFNYGTVGSEQDALMSLFSEGGWMGDMVQDGGLSTNAFQHTSELGDSWVGTPGCG